jgi:hypothetical protein
VNWKWRLPLLLLLLLACMVVLAPVVPNVTDQDALAATVTERLGIEGTAQGSVINGLFGRFDSGLTPLSGGCPPNVKCYVGSHLPGSGACGCLEFTQSKPQVCAVNPSCNGSFCFGTVKDTCCASYCIEDYPPECAGCQRVGYCSN